VTHVKPKPSRRKYTTYLEESNIAWLAGEKARRKVGGQRAVTEADIANEAIQEKIDAEAERK